MPNRGRRPLTRDDRACSERCGRWGEQAEFHQVSVFDPALDEKGPFDGTLSRYVLHHVIDPAAFVARQTALLRPGGMMVLSDHITDPDPVRARHHEAIERGPRSDPHLQPDRWSTGGLARQRRARPDRATWKSHSYLILTSGSTAELRRKSKDSVRASFSPDRRFAASGPRLSPTVRSGLIVIRCIVQGVKPAVTALMDEGRQSGFGCHPLSMSCGGANPSAERRTCDRSRDAVFANHSPAGSPRCLGTRVSSSGCLASMFWARRIFPQIVIDPAIAQGS